jgi:hypothetical protein
MAKTVVLIVLLSLTAMFFCYVARQIVWWWLEDFISFFVRRKDPASPPDWSALLKGEIPQASDAKIEREKTHLSKSCEVHGECIPRTSHYGLIARPLRREE